MARLTVLAAIILACDAFRVPLGAPAMRFATSMETRAAPLLQAEGEEDAMPVAAPAAPPAPPAKPKSKAGSMPTDFLGVFDTTTAGGSLGASLVVAAAFGVLVEFIRFVDPNPSAPSIFGSAWS